MDFESTSSAIPTGRRAVSEYGTIEDVYEPYLVKNGFINRTPKGRVATELAFEHFERKKA